MWHYKYKQSKFIHAITNLSMQLQIYPCNYKLEIQNIILLNSSTTREGMIKNI